jgi:hypothetical protein
MRTYPSSRFPKADKSHIRLPCLVDSVRACIPVADEQERIGQPRLDGLFTAISIRPSGSITTSMARWTEASSVTSIWSMVKGTESVDGVRDVP